MTVHSDWDDWLPREIASTEPDGVVVWYLGCNGFALRGRGGTTLFVDPYLGTGDPPRTIRMIPVPFDPRDIESVDGVFATHEHVDHVHGPSQGPLLADSGANLYGPPASVEVARTEEALPSNYDIEEDQLETVEVGTTVDIGEFTVHVEPAYDPDAEHPVSYVFEHGAGTFFHGGDSKPAAEFADVGKRYDIDLAALAYGTQGMMPDRDTGDPTRTKWYNDENELVEAANALRADRLLPSHWDMWKRLTADPTVLYHHVRSFDRPRRLELLEIGDRTTL